MNKKRKTVLLITFLMSLTILICYSYSATRSVETYVIDAETCINCGNCYNNYPETFDEFNGYATWKRLGGSSLGLLFLFYPTEIERIQAPLAKDECPTESIIIE
ncbi:MAG: ferredoxin [Bacteroidales bacterium]